MRVASTAIGGALDNLGSLGESLGDVAWWAVALMVVSHACTHSVRAVAWGRLSQAAIPEVKVSNFGMVLAMGAGTAVNSILPARMGEPVKLWAAEKAAPGAAKATLLGALLTIMAADGLISMGVIGAGGFLGLGGPIVERADLFTGIYGLIAAGILVALIVGAVWLARARRGWFSKMKSQLMEGLEPLESTGWYLTHVISLQLVGWIFRAITSTLALIAIGIPVTLPHVAAILVAQALASSIPFAPGGFALKLGIFLLAFADVADTALIVAFAVLYELTLYATNLFVGFLSLGYLFRGMRWKDIVARVKRIGDDEESAPRAEPVELHDGA